MLTELKNFVTRSTGEKGENVHIEVSKINTENYRPVFSHTWDFSPGIEGFKSQEPPSFAGMFPKFFLR